MASLKSPAQIELSYRCVTCALIFDNPLNLKQHIQESHLSVVSESIQAQNNANSSCDNRDQVQNLEQEESQIPLISNVATLHVDVKCLKCDGIFKSSEIEAHVHQVHSSEQTEDKENKCHKCPVCGKILSNKRSLKKHISRVHQGTEACSCNICDRKFSYRFSLKNHMAKHHGNIEEDNEIIDDIPMDFHMESLELPEPQENDQQSLISFNCDICDTNYASSTMLKIHCELVHKTNNEKDAIKENKSTCPVSNDTSNLEGNQSSLAVKTCDICVKTFCSNSSLKNHHAAVHVGKKNKCDICSAEYAWLSDLQRHRKTAHPDNHHQIAKMKPKRGTCLICDKLFDGKAKLEEHIKELHMNHDRYQCPLCATTCLNPFEVRRHKKRKHSEAMSQWQNKTLDPSQIALLLSKLTPLPVNVTSVTEKKRRASENEASFKEIPKKVARFDDGTNDIDKPEGRWVKSVIISYKDFIAAENHKGEPDKIAEPANQLTVDDPQKCNLCDRVFKNKARLKHHVTCMHTKDRTKNVTFARKK